MIYLIIIVGLIVLGWLLIVFDMWAHHHYRTEYQKWLASNERNNSYDHQDHNQNIK